MAVPYPDSFYTLDMALAECKSFRKLLMFPTMSAVVLMNLSGAVAYAQDENETCPCFDTGEVESIFLRGRQLSEEEGTSDCSAEDYSVELNAEIVVWDQDYAITAQARVEWFDIDPGGCVYIDATSDPVVERDISWPSPAPEALARACFNIISSVIARADTAGNCTTYP